MKKHFLAFLFSVIWSVTFGQTQHIQYSKGKIIYQNQRILKPKEIRSILLQNPDPDLPQFVQKYKNSNGAAAAFGLIGGGAVGYSLGSAIGGGKVNAGLLSAGAGSVLIGFLFDSFARKNLKLAVNSYNTSWQSPLSH